MHKVNFLEIYDSDTGNKEFSNFLSSRYRRAAKMAAQKSSLVVTAMKEDNPDIKFSWHFREIHEPQIVMQDKKNDI